MLTGLPRPLLPSNDRQATRSGAGEVQHLLPLKLVHKDRLGFFRATRIFIERLTLQPLSAAPLPSVAKARIAPLHVRPPIHVPIRIVRTSRAARSGRRRRRRRSPAIETLAEVVARNRREKPHPGPFLAFRVGGASQVADRAQRRLAAGWRWLQTLVRARSAARRARET